MNTKVCPEVKTGQVEPSLAAHREGCGCSVHHAFLNGGRLMSRQLNKEMHFCVLFWVKWEKQVPERHRVRHKSCGFFTVVEVVVFFTVLRTFLLLWADDSKVIVKMMIIWIERPQINVMVVMIFATYPVAFFNSRFQSLWKICVLLCMHFPERVAAAQKMEWPIQIQPGGNWLSQE